jgi:hypothetical protein
VRCIHAARLLTKAAASSTDLHYSSQWLIFFTYCRLRFRGMWGSIEIASRGGQNETTITFRVDHADNPDQICAGGDIQGVDN